jgi:hypothetical protein
VPDNTDIHVGTRRIKLGWVPEGGLQEGKGCGETQGSLGSLRMARRSTRRAVKEEEESSVIPPWLPEHLCKHCGVQSKAGATSLAHTCNTRKRRNCQEISITQKRTAAQDTQGKIFDNVKCVPIKTSRIY